MEIKDLFIQYFNDKFDLFNISNEKLNNFKFKFFKLIHEAKFEPKYLEIINNESIYVVIKYIDLTDIIKKRRN